MLRKITILMNTEVPKCGDVYTPQEYHKAMSELQMYAFYLVFMCSAFCKFFVPWTLYNTEKTKPDSKILNTESKSTNSAPIPIKYYFIQNYYDYKIFCHHVFPQGCNGFIIYILYLRG